MLHLLKELSHLPNLATLPNENLEQYDDAAFCVFWKDRKGVLQGANNTLAKSAGLVRGKELVGKTDFELFSALSARAFMDNDQKIFSAQRATLFIEPVLSLSKSDKQRVAFSYKRALLSSTGEVFGLSGVSVILPLDEISFHETLFSFDKSYVGDNISSEQLLSKREKEVFYYLMRGRTAKNSAEVMGISPRTVEKHISNIKTKLNLNNKSRLIEKAFNYFK